MATTTPSSSSASCDHLTSPNPATVTLASIILLGILISYLPQHLKIITRRSSEGLSPWWVLLGGLSSIAAIGNILVLPASRADVKCCKEVSGGECAAALLGIAQIGLQWGCFMFMFVSAITPAMSVGNANEDSVMLFLTFFPSQPNEHQPTDLTASLGSLTAASPSSPPRRRDAIIVTASVLLALFATGLLSLATIAAFPHHTQNLANALGSIAGILSGIQYVPQIYFTWKLKDVKSLSIVTMIIQVPGAFLFAFSLWLRVGWEGWSTWAVYVVTGILQAILLTLGVTYYLDKRKRGLLATEDGTDEEVEEDGEVVDERSALLGNGGGNGSVKRPIAGTQRSKGSERGLAMLYAATPPEHDSDRSQ